MNIDGLSSELDRLRERLGPALCAERHCATVAQTEVTVLPDGREARIGTPPQPLCEGCPEHAKPAHQRGIRHVEVVRNAYGTTAGDAEQPRGADSATSLPPVGRGGPAPPEIPQAAP